MLIQAIDSLNNKTILWGRIFTFSDGFFMVNGNVRGEIRVLPNFSQLALNIDINTGTTAVTVVGQFDNFGKLILEKVISHNSIAERAFYISTSKDSKSAGENWLRAERELLFT